ncbi:hypothetical protein BH09PAT1_BH09PAT1_4380 [soil metagenome]
MSYKEESPVTPETVAVTENLQRQSIEAYLTIAHELKTGMSESDIAKNLVGELAHRGINDFWYNIPILVLIGSDRFQQMADPDYAVKSPSEDVRLKPGDPFFIDVHPRDKSTRWGNFASTGIYQPGDEQLDELLFLQRMQGIQEQIVGSMTGIDIGAKVAQGFNTLFENESISLLDVRGNFGHTMGYGQKSDYERSFLDESNNQQIGGKIWGIEPGGVKTLGNKLLVARMEDCVHIPRVGEPRVLGRQNLPPVAFPNR